MSSINSASSTGSLDKVDEGELDTVVLAVFLGGESHEVDGEDVTEDDDDGVDDDIVEEEREEEDEVDEAAEDDHDFLVLFLFNPES